MGHRISVSMLKGTREGLSFPWEPPEDATQANMPLLLERLKPCPFCGMEPYIRLAGTSSGYKVTCRECDIPEVYECWGDFSERYEKRMKKQCYEIPWDINMAGTMNRIIKRWNQRPLGR